MTREINLGNLIIPLIKPQKGIDYYTPAEKQEIVNEVTNNVNDVILPQEEIRQSNEITRQNNENTRQAQETSRTISENERQNAETERIEAESIRQDNESSRESAEQERTETFNTQMKAVNTAIQGIHTSQEAYDQNAQEKTTAFNTNATNKMNAYNTNATEKIAEYDAHVHDYEQELSNKVDKVAGKVLSTNDFTNEKSQQIETNKTAIQTNAGAITALSGRVAEVEGDITDIQEEQTEQNTSIEALQAENVKLKKELDTQKSIINQMPQVEDEGYDATLNNTIKAPFTKFDVEGHSEQESTEGYNQYYMDYNDNTYNFGGINIVSTKTGFSLSGSRTSNGTFTLISRILTLPAGTYTLKLKKASTLRIGLSKTDYTAIRTISVGLTSATFTLSEETDVCMALSFVANTNYNESNELMIYSGTEDKPFEEYTYGASPNPSYEQPIKSAGDNIQLFDKSTATASALQGDGTTLSSTTLTTSDFIEIDVTKTYYKTITNSARVKLYDENKNAIVTSSASDISNFGNAQSFTIPVAFQNAKYIRFSMENQYVDTFKLEPGTTATPYSPYGMGSITEKIVNGNWLLNGKTFTPSTGGWYDQLGTATTSLSQINSNTNYYDLKANTNYTIKIDKYKNINAYQLIFVNKNGIHGIVNTTNLANPVTFKPTENMRVWLRAQIVETNVETYFDAQLELGSTANPYIPHEEQTYSIYTQQPFRSIGDVRDCFFKNTIDSPYYDENLVENGWYERHDIGEEILDENTNIGSQDNIAYYNLIGRKSTTSILQVVLCNKLHFSCNANSATNAQANMENLSIGVNNNGTSKNIFIKNADISTTERFKNWFGEIRPLIQFIRENPTNLLCTTEQINILENIPSTFAGQTNVFSEDEVKAYLRAKGLKDLNKMFSDITNAITAQGANV